MIKEQPFIKAPLNIPGWQNLRYSDTVLYLGICSFPKGNPIAISALMKRTGLSRRVLLESRQRLLSVDAIILEMQGQGRPAKYTVRGQLINGNFSMVHLDALCNPCLTYADKVVYYALCGYSNPTNPICFPLFSQIEERIRISDYRVFLRSIRNLELNGLIERQKGRIGHNRVEYIISEFIEMGMTKSNHVEVTKKNHVKNGGVTKRNTGVTGSNQVGCQKGTTLGDKKEPIIDNIDNTDNLIDKGGFISSDKILNLWDDHCEKFPNLNWIGEDWLSNLIEIEQKIPSVKDYPFDCSRDDWNHLISINNDENDANLLFNDMS